MTSWDHESSSTSLCARRSAGKSVDVRQCIVMANEIPKIPRVRTHIRCSPVLDTQHAVVVCTSTPAIQWLASYNVVNFFGSSLATSTTVCSRRRKTPSTCHRVHVSEYMSPSTCLRVHVSEYMSPSTCRSYHVGLPMIARCLDPCAPCIVCRSSAPGVGVFARLASYYSTHFLPLSCLPMFC